MARLGSLQAAVPGEPALRAYFRLISLELVSSRVQSGGRVFTRWRLFGGPHLFRIDGKSDFTSLPDLWLEWYCAHPVREHRYAQALVFAESAARWSPVHRERMERWFQDPTCTERGDDRRSRRHRTDPARHRWPWSVLHVVDATHAVEALQPPWNTPGPSPLHAASVTVAGLGDPAWQQRALVTACFDMQIPALFVPALKKLLGDPEAAVLGECIADAALHAPVLAPRRL
jgi:hypothetical protein